MQRNLYCAVFLLAAGVFSSLAAAQSSSPVDFNRDIRPLLSDRCFACHGPDANARKAELRLDVEVEAKKFAISPGDLEDSEFWARITHEDAKDRMPPEELHKPLTQAEIDLLGRWIKEGAVWAEHWAWIAPKRPNPPSVSNQAWSKNPIDRFVFKELDKAGLKPSPEADRETLLRRVSLDLTGLPPTPAEIDAFLADTSPNAYENVVDRLLASPHYGERMAQDWLDGARYADTNGFQNDFQRYMWPWRDWVIDAYNRNLPFDEFAVEQLAGDMLPDATESQRVASGFNRNNRANTEGGSIEEEWYVENRIDRVETTSTVFLGLTMGCARCHDHKYDPISQKEFYSFYAFFNSTEDKGFYEETRGNAGPIVELPTPEHTAKLAEFDTQVAALRAEVEAVKAQATDLYPKTLARFDTTPAPDFAATATLRVASENDIKARKAAAPWRVDGLVGPAFYFDGTEAMEARARQDYAFLKDAPFTVSAWVRPDKGGALFSRVSKKKDVQRGVDAVITGDGKIIVHLTGAGLDDAIKVTTDNRLKMQSWAHVAIAYDGSGKAEGVKVYVSGRPAAITINTNALTQEFDTKAPLLLGRILDGEYFKGTISDFRIYEQALPEESVNALIETTLRATRVAYPSDARVASLTGFLEVQHSFDVRAKEAIANAKQSERDEYYRANVPTVMVMKELAETKPTYRLVRGAYDAPDTTEALAPRVPAFLPPLPADAPPNRLTLAQWIVDPANPLTARVQVNKFWAKFFGTGFVKSPENFGLQSEPRSNADLFDWLATEFIRNGWDMKAIQKTIVMSATYKQDSAVSPALLERDPENRLLARGPRFRLSVETIRDTALAASGLLSPKIGGPSVMPYQPDGLWAELAGGAGQGPYVQATDEDLYRRTLYTYRKRTVPHPITSTFDAPSYEICKVMRARTNTPLQALALLNDTTYVEAARNLAQRMLQESTSQDGSPLRHGFRLVMGRYPTHDEEQLLQGGLDKFTATYQADAEAAKTFVSNGLSPVPAELDTSTLAAYTALAGVMLNLDEAITQE